MWMVGHWRRYWMTSTLTCGNEVLFPIPPGTKSTHISALEMWRLLWDLKWARAHWWLRSALPLLPTVRARGLPPLIGLQLKTCCWLMQRSRGFNESSHVAGSGALLKAAVADFGPNFSFSFTSEDPKWVYLVSGSKKWQTSENHRARSHFMFARKNWEDLDGGTGKKWSEASEPRWPHLIIAVCWFYGTTVVKFQTPWKGKFEQMSSLHHVEERTFRCWKQLEFLIASGLRCERWNHSGSSSRTVHFSISVRSNTIVQDVSVSGSALRHRGVQEPYLPSRYHRCTLFNHGCTWLRIRGLRLQTCWIRAVSPWRF